MAIEWCIVGASLLLAWVTLSRSIERKPGGHRARAACPTCGYSLLGLDLPRACPECGSECSKNESLPGTISTRFDRFTSALNLLVLLAIAQAWGPALWAASFFWQGLPVTREYVLGQLTYVFHGRYDAMEVAAKVATFGLLSGLVVPWMSRRDMARYYAMMLYGTFLEMTLIALLQSNNVTFEDRAMYCGGFGFGGALPTLIVVLRGGARIERGAFEP